MTADAVGGVWTYALDLAAGLVRFGVRITLAVLGPEARPHQAAAARRVDGLQLHQAGLPLDWLASDQAAARAAGARLAEMAVGADLVHLNSPAYAAGVQFAAPVVGACHSCVATWWDAVHGGALPPDLSWRRDLVAKGYRNATRLLAPTAAFAAATARHYQLPPPQTVHNGRTPAPPSSAPGGHFVFTAGRLWDRGKGVAVLDQAAAALSWPVLAAGPLQGEDGSAITLTHIHALGRLDAVGIAAHLAARPIFASAAFYEPFGLAVLEAAAAGCALVLSDIPSFRELWEGAADFVSSGDPAALAAAITRLANDPARRLQQGAAAQAHAARYTVAAMAAKTFAVYQQALAA